LLGAGGSTQSACAGRLAAYANATASSIRFGEFMIVVLAQC